MSSIKEALKNPFTFDKDFKREFDCMMKVYDEAFSEFHKVTSSTTVNIPDEYGVCNNSYKLRFITPSNISSYISYVMKALKNHLIMPNIGDMEKFTVANAKQFLNENGCVPIENSSIYGLYQYTSDEMTLNDLIVLCENDVYHTSVCSKYDMTQRKVSMKKDVDHITNLHFGANIKKIVDALPGLIDKNTDFSDLDFPVRSLIVSYVEAFILFAITLNCVTMSNMILYCVPKSTYNKKLMTDPKLEVKYNSLMEENDEREHSYTECCLLKTNHLMLSNKIPFNINMRDIVLQDMHPQFKDTVSALHFITKDNRSPISLLLVKHGNEKKCHYVNPDTVMNLFVHDMRRCFDRDDEFFANYEKVDFHTDVNWLDKIAYGNNYLNGNYRSDSNGNHNFNPITNTLDVLYRMFGDCALTTSEELANHILIVSDLMHKIIIAYKDYHIKNWDLVRDILAVLGEILTRSMIKLYDNHMTVFVAKDNMNDVDIPGYLYTESFVMEADDAKPKVEVEEKEGFKGAVQKAKVVVSQMFHKFIAWIQSVLSKTPIKFWNNHQAEINWIKKNENLNKEIEQSLNNNTFTPTVTNFPDYHIPARELTSKKISELVKKYLEGDFKTPVTVDNIKADFYPPKLREALNIKVAQEAYMMEQDSSDKNSTNTQEQQMLSNYFLYGDPNHQPATGNTTTTLTSEQWKTLYTDLLNTAPLLQKEVKELADDLNKACTDVQKRMKDAESKLKSFEGQENVNADEKNQASNQLKRCEDLAKALRDVTNSYHTTMLNVIQSKFYATSYTLYRDIVTAYNQQKSKNTTTTSQSQPAQPQQQNANENKQ